MKLFQRYLAPLCGAAAFVALALLAGCGGGGRDAILGLPAATLSTLTVTPASATLAVGATQQLTATATFSDGSTRDVGTAAAWTSATPASVTVGAASGLATAAAPGSAVVTAAYEGKSASATLTVGPAVLTAIAIAPLAPSIAIGAPRQFSVLGTYTDHTIRDVSAQSTFGSGTPAIASIDSASGLAAGLSVGSTLITATMGTLNASTLLTVTPASLLSIAVTPQDPTVLIAATRQLAVVATYSDNTRVDVTLGSTFASATPAIASVANGGLVTGVGAGSSVVTASFKGANATTTVTVPVNVTLSSIAVTPANASIMVGEQQQYTATASYSDASSTIISASWSSSSADNGTINQSGLATGVAAGGTTITASFGGRTGNALLTVTAEPVPPPPPPSAVDLGSAANFAVLAGTSITNNSGGTTLVTGDVGSPSQTVDPPQAAGYTNYKSGAILATALADLQTAITDANGRACTVNLFGGVDLGGLVLGPGVYCISGAISITGTLTLNGPGVYIFRTPLTLDSTANSIVALNNGATSAQLYWLPIGPTTLGANSVFKGNILGQSAAITVGDNTTLLNGRVLTAAAVTLSNNQITK